MLRESEIMIKIKPEFEQVEYDKKLYSPIESIQDLAEGDQVLFNDSYHKKFLECTVKNKRTSTSATLSSDNPSEGDPNRKTILYVEDGYNTSLVYKAL